jgi:cation diffusion facilitator family transporter
MTTLGILIDAALFLLKLVAGLAAGSLAILADAVNSLLRMLYGLGVNLSVEQSHKKAEKGLPFFHGRATPMLAFSIAVLTGIAGYAFLRSGLLGLWSGTAGHTLTWLIATSLTIAIIGKVLQSHQTLLAALATRSQALLESASEQRDDILVTLTALAGLVFASVGASWTDCAAAVGISILFFVRSYRLGRKNIDYLVGEAPDTELDAAIREAVSTVRGVRGIRMLRVHHLGNFLQVELAIHVNGTITTQASHHIAMTVQHDVERLPGVDKAFVIADSA